MAGKRKVVYEMIATSKLRMLERNPQYLTPSQMDALKRSIERDGFLVPILVAPLSNGEMEVVSGNHRFMAAKELGFKQLPCVVASLRKPDRQRIAVNLNLIHGDPTADQLAPFLADMELEALKGIHLDGKLKRECMEFDDHLAEQLENLAAVKGLDSETSKNRPDCVCPKCGRRHQSKS